MKTIKIATKHHEHSNNTQLGAEFSFTEAGHLELPMKGVNEFVSTQDALKLALFILENCGMPLIASIKNSCEQLRKTLYDFQLADEGSKKHNLHYINRIESVVNKLRS